ncbi:MAG: phosphoenolpyruvate carboxykinase (ATP), partial [Elusimicrobiales bacterium]|nr:phosphoenolpyruvate carboxykinase (ATP) [Elusimicrobiales bacterium]
AIEGGLDNAEFEKDDVFGFIIPKKLGDISPEILNPSKAWKDKAEYGIKRKELASLFIKNFKKFDIEDEDICNAGPKI